MIPKGFFVQAFVFGHHHAAFAYGEYFAGHAGETSNIGLRSHAFASPLPAVCMRTVADQADVVFAADVT